MLSRENVAKATAAIFSNLTRFTRFILLTHFLHHLHCLCQFVSRIHLSWTCEKKTIYVRNVFYELLFEIT
jgi:hypothetical protein